MLSYEGKIYFDTPLSQKEVDFLNEWQNKLVEIHYDYQKASNKKDKEIISESLNFHSGVAFDEHQRWTIFFAMSPMISFKKEYIELSGSSKKGNMREALLSYQHFFLNEFSVLKECMSLDFLKPHSFKHGIVESYKNTLQEESNWCYIVEDNVVYSVDAATIAEYLDNPKKWPKTEKEDTFQDKLDRYFPPLIKYATLKKSINESNSTKNNNKTNNKLKI